MENVYLYCGDGRVEPNVESLCSLEEQTLVATVGENHVVAGVVVGVVLTEKKTSQRQANL